MGGGDIFHSTRRKEQKVSMLHLNHFPRFNFPRITGLAGVLLLSLPFATACGTSTNDETNTDGGSSGGGAPAIGGIAKLPTVLSNTPLQDAVEVPINGYISVTFSEEMASADINEKTFTLKYKGHDVPGTVIYSDSSAAFWPAEQLLADTKFTAMITDGAINPHGKGLKGSHTWSFVTGKTSAVAPVVNLGTAGNYVVLSKSGISTVPPSAITGNLGVSPAAASYITGFSLVADPTNVFSTSTQVVGKIYAANYAAPTPSNLTTAIGDMQLAYTSAAARAANVIELGAGNIGGMTITPGVYKWSSGVMIPANVTLSGNSKAVWIFEIAQDLSISNSVQVTLAGGGLPKNVFWQVAGAVNLGTAAHLEGVVLSKTSINMNGGASLNGRLLAQTAVTLNANAIVQSK
jgi:hypothetical protein